MNSESNFNDNLDKWVGEYKIFESASEPNGPLIMIDYEIEIYKENDNYYAEIAMDGQTALVRAKAKVDGEEEFISLRFL